MNNSLPLYYKKSSPSSPRGPSRNPGYPATPSTFNNLPVYYLPYQVVMSETEPRYDPSTSYFMNRHSSSSSSSSSTSTSNSNPNPNSTSSSLQLQPQQPLQGLHYLHQLPLTHNHTQFLPRSTRYQLGIQPQPHPHKSRHGSYDHSNIQDPLLIKSRTEPDLPQDLPLNNQYRSAAPQLPHTAILPSSAFLYPVSFRHLPYHPISSSGGHHQQRYSSHYPISTTATTHGPPGLAPSTFRRWSLIDSISTSSLTPLTSSTPSASSSSTTNNNTNNNTNTMNTNTTSSNLIRKRGSIGGTGSTTTDFYDHPRRRRSINKSMTSRNITRKSHNAKADPENIRYNVFLEPADDCEAYQSTPLSQILDSIKVKKYLTLAIDPQRAYLTVYEYPVNKQSIIWDYETGFVHLTGIWKALLLAEPETATTTRNNLKADIVKLLETTPKQYQQHIKRIRGGFLKIQGTWLPYEMCKAVAKKFCYRIRYELVPLFGAQFPRQCLTPDNPNFGKLRLDDLDEEIRKYGNVNVQTLDAIGASNLTSCLIAKKTPLSLTNHIQQPPSMRYEPPDIKSQPLSSFNLDNSPRYSTYGTVSILQDASPLNGTMDKPFRRSSLLLPVPRSGTESASGMDNLSYNEMYDLVSALRCLQSLRTGNLSTSNSNTGIVSILEAAGVSKKQPRRLLKIHDLISE